MTGDVADFFLTISKSSDHIIVSMRRPGDWFIYWLKDYINENSRPNLFDWLIWVVAHFFLHNFLFSLHLFSLRSLPFFSTLPFTLSHFYHIRLLLFIYLSIYRMIDWLIYRLIDRLIDLLIDLLIDWIICWLIDWMIDWLIDWFSIFSQAVA